MAVILVTGAAKRIGQAIAIALGINHKLIIHYNNSYDEALETSEKIRSNGGQADIVQQNLLDDHASIDLFTKAKGIFGQIDVIINSASLFLPDTLQNLSDELWQQHQKIHVTVPMQLTHFLMQHISGDNTGNVINIIDQRINRPTPKFFSYTASKLFLASLTKQCAIACAPIIRVNGIAPGATLPNMRQSQNDFDKQSKLTPLSIPVELSDITNAVQFILNTPSMTGEIITLDSGQGLDWQTPNYLQCVE